MLTSLTIAILVVLAVFWLFIMSMMILIIYGSATIRVPFVPVARYVIKTVKKEMPLKAGDIFYDLGSGDGRAVFAMAQAYPEATIIGFEKGPFPYFVSRCALAFSKTKNASFLFKDFSRVPLSDATHIYMYLFPDVVQKLLPKFESELRPGTQVISCDFPFTARAATRTMPVVRGRKKYTLYFYEF